MSQFTLGQHDQAIQLILDRVERIEEKVDKLALALAERQGERRVVVWFVSVASGVVGALITTLGKAIAKLL